MMFSHSGITEEAPKYSDLIQALTKREQAHTKVADILQNLSQDEPYTQLKTSLLERLCNKSENSPYTILKQCIKGSDTITQGWRTFFIEWVTNGILLRKNGKVGHRFNNIVVETPRIRSSLLTTPNFRNCCG